MTKQEPDGLGDALRRRGSVLQTIRAVAWSFFGVRKSSEYEKDISQLNPLHVVIAGLVLAVLFVVALLLVVKWVLSSGVIY
jgi:preprotein translocase subunit Sec61beta